MKKYMSILLFFFSSMYASEDFLTLHYPPEVQKKIDKINILQKKIQQKKKEQERLTQSLPEFNEIKKAQNSLTTIDKKYKSQLDTINKKITQAKKMLANDEKIQKKIYDLQAQIKKLDPKKNPKKIAELQKNLESIYITTPTEKGVTLSQLEKQKKEIETKINKERNPIEQKVGQAWQKIHIQQKNNAHFKTLTKQIQSLNKQIQQLQGK